MALISLEHVTKMYERGARPALDDISVDIKRGEFVFLVGASGSGKTTLLSLLLHEELADKGEIHVAGNDLRRISDRMVPRYRRSIGFVFQDFKLLPKKTVWQNVAFALEVLGKKHSQIKKIVPQVLQTVGLTGKEGRYPTELSGGEAQRVAIARAYVNHPTILLADEPTGNLDPTTSVGIMEVLEAINRTGTTIVMATHNEEIVNSMRKRVVELHEGVVVRDEESGSYDSAQYYSDAPVGIGVGATSHVGMNDERSAHDERSARDEQPQGDVTEEHYNSASIEKLAESVHSGRKGRYGKIFADPADTISWGNGLDSVHSAPTPPAPKLSSDNGSKEGKK
jgi:cell division transport system ATP-binding protein